MDIQTFKIEGPKLITVKKFQDDRGFFTERFSLREFKELNLPHEFKQENFSRSKPNVLRGLHLQVESPQGKLVTCTNGAIYDAIVDVRKSSPTYGQHIGVELRGDHPQWFWVPQGFAHGFCCLSDVPADVSYKVDNYYNPKGEVSILWNDPELKISWPLASPIVSEKDRKAMTFQEFKKQNINL